MTTPALPCDCLNYCGDDPWLRDGRSKPCDELVRRRNEEAAKTEERKRIEQQTARAFEIADESMTELLRSRALKTDEIGMLWGLVSEDGEEVATLAEADPAIQDAVEWLQQRSLAEVIGDEAYECILLKEAL